MPNLIQKLSDYDPKWRENISPNPLEAAVEIGLLDPEDLDDEQEFGQLRFDDE